MSIYDDVTGAVRSAFRLGEIHWQQSDSEYSSQWKKADATRTKYEDLLTEISAKVQEADAALAAKDAEIAGYREANKYMAGELEDALEDARKYAEAQREIARLREALAATFDALDRSSSPFPLSLEMTMAVLDHAKAALANGGGE